jgi:hypothetical protein
MIQHGLRSPLRSAGEGFDPPYDPPFELGCDRFNPASIGGCSIPPIPPHRIEGPATAQKGLRRPPPGRQPIGRNHDRQHVALTSAKAHQHRHHEGHLKPHTQSRMQK